MGRKWVGSREIRHRQERVRSAIASQLVELRSERGVTQRDLATGSGIDRTHLSRVERGRAAASVDVLVAVAANLGADVSVRLFPTSGPRIRDHSQAPMLEALVSRLDRAWRGRVEVPVPEARGVIDLVLHQRETATWIVCEAHSQLRSIDLVVRRLNEKTLAFGRLDAREATVSSLLLVRSTESTRRTVRLHEATLSHAFPGRYVDAIQALTGHAMWPGPTLLWVRLEGAMGELQGVPPRGIAVGRS